MENKKPELYYCYCIPMRLWIIDNFYDGTKRAETKEWWDSFIGKATEHYRLVEVNDNNDDFEMKW